MCVIYLCIIIKQSKTLTTMTKEQFISMAIEQVNTLLKNEEINKVYQSMSTKEDAEKWIFEIVTQAMFKMMPNTVDIFK